MTHTTVSFFFGAALVAVAIVSETAAVEPWDRVVCIQSEIESKPDTGKLCSAFLVNSNERLFLVTAGHASEETNPKSKLRYRDPDGVSQWVALKTFFRASANPWQRDKRSDFAVAELLLVDGAETYFAHLTALSISLESISTETPSRTTGIVTVGFPLAIGAGEVLSPVAIVGHVASRETDTKNRWGHEPIVYCSPPLAQGTSGGPAFLDNQPEGSLVVVAMYIGVIHDSSGAKLSKMVPARLIRASIMQMQGGD
ncbi:trypsin-like peptidase domain-containing protein [Rhodopirellula bahusiensis]|uniref:Serine protease n=1 Tax=Rhodopirellula bahusiensis TaxID=2014065 RepID=A0A2G1W860_9BACT|nr:trypsin-like peptidase domain-containing protein [Rhodopirellula bahusiensis]PHQ35201.1 serine protease [Rhodopirellula bahusiensis]